jgi:nucleoside-diphosphate-sugar epimerase
VPLIATELATGAYTLLTNPLSDLGPYGMDQVRGFKFQRGTGPDATKAVPQRHWLRDVVDHWERRWHAAIAGCEYVHHVASPLLIKAPKDENEVIGPARDGTLRVLRFARETGVRRVIVTSSFAAVGYGHKAKFATYDETAWTDPKEPGLSTYVKSKTLAERAAWDFMQRESGSMEMTVINPTAIFGPALSPAISGSTTMIRMILTGKMPAIRLAGGSRTQRS